MIEFTCIYCGHKYNEMTGDLDERCCNDCLEKFYDPTTEEEENDS